MPTEFEQEVWTWWGNLRRRSDERLPSRVEVATVLLQPALVFDVLCLVVISLVPVRIVLFQVLGPTWSVLLIPALLSLIPLVVAFVVPSSWFLHTPIPAWVALARERGFLRKADALLTALACVTLGIGAILRLGLMYWPLIALIAVLTVASAISLTMFKPTVLTSRKWQVEIPEWLHTNEGRGEPSKMKEPALPEPEEGAKRYDFVSVVVTREGGKAYPIGVLIDKLAVLDPLRKMNKASGGILYQKNAKAVVLSEGEPAKGLGLSEVDRLCAQIAQIARATGMTRYQWASSILRFVQRAIKYELDRDSTQRLLGEAFEEYGRFPVETLDDGVGDCECSSMLCCALLARSGFNCALLYVTVAAGYHAAIGLRATDDLLTSGIPGIDDGAAYVSTVQNPAEKYLYGETATDDPNPIGFGVVPLEWRSTIQFNKIDPIPAPTQ